MLMCRRTCSPASSRCRRWPKWRYRRRRCCGSRRGTIITTFPQAVQEAITDVLAMDRDATTARGRADRRVWSNWPPVTWHRTAAPLWRDRRDRRPVRGHAYCCNSEAVPGPEAFSARMLFSGWPYPVVTCPLCRTEKIWLVSMRLRRGARETELDAAGVHVRADAPSELWLELTLRCPAHESVLLITPDADGKLTATVESCIAGRPGPP